jgi:cytosine/adenosine deaminase-related metal-dependent hydrolase
MLIRSRIILPIACPPIENGAVLISGNRIVAVGSWKDLKVHSLGEVLDLGETILLPGLINAHCHLDYTNMAGMIAPTKHFADWIKSMMALKASWSYSDFAASWVNGAQMLLRSGTTTVADIEAVPELLPDVWSSTPLRVFSFLELTCVKSSLAPTEVLHAALGKIENLQSLRHRVSVSPHALYSTTPELLELTTELCRERNLPVTTHLAESEMEFEMYQFRKGPLFEWLKMQRDTSDCGGCSPVEQMDRCGLLSDKCLAVHVNCLAKGDARLLSRRGTTVVHCPRSHAYFCHPRFPFDELSAAGVNICLGTDSLATVIARRPHPTELSLFAEMRRFSDVCIEVAPAAILQMVTMNGAKALGMTGRIGQISADAQADLIALPFKGRFSDAEDAVVNFSGDVAGSMIDGQWAIPPK